MSDEQPTIDRHAEERERRRRPRMRVSGRSLQHVVNAIAKRAAEANSAKAPPAPDRQTDGPTRHPPVSDSHADVEA